MRAPRRSRLARLLGAAGLAAAWGCASILDVSGYHDAAAELCRCGPLADDLQTCTDRVRRSLEADPERAGEWLERYVEKGCGDSCAEAAACFDAPPVCTPKDDSCEESNECCGFSRGEARCCAKTSNQHCCAQCMRCGESFERVREPNEFMCTESLKMLVTLIDCYCSEEVCAAECTANWCQGKAITDGCLACIQDQGALGACKSEYSACAADVPEPN